MSVNNESNKRESHNGGFTQTNDFRERYISPNPPKSIYRPAKALSTTFKMPSRPAGPGGKPQVPRRPKIVVKNKPGSGAGIIKPGNSFKQNSKNKKVILLRPKNKPNKPKMPGEYCLVYTVASCIVQHCGKS